MEAVGCEHCRGSCVLLLWIPRLGISNISGIASAGLLATVRDLFCRARAVTRNNYRSLLWFGVVFGLQQLPPIPRPHLLRGWLYVLTLGFASLNQQEQALAGRRVHRFCTGCPIFAEVDWFVLCWNAGFGNADRAVQLIPTYEMVSLSERSGGVTFQYAANYAYAPKDFWTFLYPFANGDIGNLTYTGKFRLLEDYGYIGALPFLLALSAPCSGGRTGTCDSFR